NQLVCGKLRRTSHDSAYQTASRLSNEPMPIMTSHARCTTLACALVGWESAGKALRPCTTVDFPVVGSESHDANPGMAMPPTTSLFELRWPNNVSGASFCVWGRSSIAANLVGSLLNAQRASESPTTICSGAATAATE